MAFPLSPFQTSTSFSSSSFLYRWAVLFFLIPLHPLCQLKFLYAVSVLPPLPFSLSLSLRPSSCWPEEQLTKSKPRGPWLWLRLQPWLCSPLASSLLPLA
ncbi:hypothetical protein ATANTOWER_000180 [Ataeniobius toweri]|uniref:Uncharacterized protein n=1 Tax=Ataeniobius toweri TaxID=208326 RepID=A0ABU7BEB3_9TELE|nr:hypothetical protein [Ataeniobius toweri]